MSRMWRWALPCYLFTLPTTVVGFVLATVFYKATDWAWYDGVLTCKGGANPDGSTKIFGRPNAQTLGWIVVYDADENWAYPDLRVHEYAHVVQAFACSLVGLVITPLLFTAAGWSPLLGLALGGFLGGVGFCVAYGMLFVYLLLKQGGGWFNAYYANPFEIQARAKQDAYIANPTQRPWGV